MRGKNAFTLIELLIVVAIIAILAAIAVPNFLEAQVRSKVSRMKANLRTIATALESYAVDTNHYAECTDTVPQFAPPTGAWAANEIWKFYPGYAGRCGSLTTPIAYLSSTDAMVDVFRLAHKFPSTVANQIMYLPTHYYKLPHTGATSSYTAQANTYGLWIIRSSGPDTYYQNLPGMLGDYGAGGWNRAGYDATNGTVSAGDIMRSQKRSEQGHAGPAGTAF